MNDLFRKFAHHTANAIGSPIAFIVALAVILVWALTGPLTGFSNTWQLIINTGTTIVTFLVVFMIQNTQNRDSKAIHLKLDELLRAIAEARTGMVDLEEMSDEELDKLEDQFRALREQQQKLDQRKQSEAARERIEGEREKVETTREKNQDQREK